MVFPRGKYKGQLISDVEQYDPSYVRWCKTNTPWMFKSSKPKTSAAEQEFMSDWQEQSKLNAYLRDNPATLIEAFGD
tara:strand:+ start:444 stop:674 length:231 start_codon:yes stop_codon:yes gene_type:complete